jgi:predicted nucleotide-binding protein (sugar kinase/HSP70/actin superfamily)
LKSLEENGFSKSDIKNKYVFFTAGSCGPCRFGMYESQYRLALKNAGYDGFRVIVFQQSEGFDQTRKNAGLEMNPDFFLGILICFMLADIVNDLAYQLRPYEINGGEVDRVLKECIEIGYQKLKTCKKIQLPKAFKNILIKNDSISKLAELIIKIIHQMFSKDHTFIVKRFKEKFSNVKVDYLRIKPIVKIIGEFWAQTTEGDGNFCIHSFLESEGAQVFPEALGNWILYISHQTRLRITDQIQTVYFQRNLFKKIKLITKLLFVNSLLTFGEKLFEMKHNHLRRILNKIPYSFAPQNKLRRYAEKYFNPRIEGGEGHLEVGKSIYYTNAKICNMLVSLKPFGCMPSTQSDGVMSTLTTHYPNILFIPIETSGEGAINAYSRIQMTLNEAKESAWNEFNKLLKEKKINIQLINEFIRKNPKFSLGLLKNYKSKKYITISANFLNTISKKVKFYNSKI